MARFSKLLERSLEPEWLDALPASDPRAARSRSDLRRINAVMGNARAIAGALRERLHREPGRLRIADLGSGDGALTRAVARRVGGDVELTLVDRAYGDADALEFLSQRGPSFDAIIANLFLHHLDDNALHRLMCLVAGRTNLFVACEPRRSAVALAASRLLGLAGCNDVTRHDATASVRAGFCGEELSLAWPRDRDWQLSEAPAWPFSHLFIARRRDGS